MVPCVTVPPQREQDNKPQNHSVLEDLARCNLMMPRRIRSPSSGSNATQRWIRFVRPVVASPSTAILIEVGPSTRCRR